VLVFDEEVSRTITEKEVAEKLREQTEETFQSLLEPVMYDVRTHLDMNDL
jgi:hypothetical protein